MRCDKLIVFLFIILLIGFVSAQLETGYEDTNDIKVSLTKPTIVTNLSYAWVNSSNFWDSLNTPADINTVDLTDDNTYVKTSGDTMLGDLSLGAGASANNLIGDGFFLGSGARITYLYGPTWGSDSILCLARHNQEGVWRNYIGPCSGNDDEKPIDLGFRSKLGKYNATYRDLHLGRSLRAGNFLINSTGVFFYNNNTDLDEPVWSVGSPIKYYREVNFTKAIYGSNNSELLIKSNVNVTNYNITVEDLFVTNLHGGSAINILDNIAMPNYNITARFINAININITNINVTNIIVKNLTAKGNITADWFFGNLKAGDLKLYDSGADAIITTSDGRLLLSSTDNDVILSVAGAGDGITLNAGSNGDIDINSGGTGNIFLDSGSMRLEIDTTRIGITADGNRLTLGASDDLQLSHDGTNSKIITTTGDLLLQSTGSELVNISKNLNVVGDADIGGIVSLGFGDLVSEQNPDTAEAIRLKGTSSDVDVVIGDVTGYFSVWNAADNSAVFYVNNLGNTDIAGDLIATGKGTFANLDVDTLNFNNNIISDSTGTISFSDDNLRTTSGDISTAGGTVALTSNGVVTTVLTITAPTQNWKFLNIGTQRALALQSQESGKGSFFKQYSKDGDASDDVTYRIYGRGTPTQVVNREFFDFGWDASEDYYYGGTFSTGSGNVKSINFFTSGNTNQLVLETDGSINMSGKLNVINNATFNKDVIIEGTLRGGSPVKIDGINITNNLFKLRENRNQSTKFTLTNLNKSSNASAIISAVNDVGHSMSIGIGSSGFMIGLKNYFNVTALFSKSRGKFVFANFFNQMFLWMYNPLDDGDPNNLVELMRLDENGLNVSGNIFSNNTFIPQYIYSHNNATISLVSVNAWRNITFDQEDANIKFGISHVYNDNTNHTFTINQDGIYDIEYNFDVIDTSLGASDIDVAGRVIYTNGTEIIGSVFETDIIKQDIETELSHSLLAKFYTGDKIVFQFVADDVDVQISTHGTFGDHPESASIEINMVAKL